MDDRMTFDGDDLDAVTPNLAGLPEVDDAEPVDVDGEEPAIDDPEVDL